MAAHAVALSMAATGGTMSKLVRRTARLLALAVTLGYGSGASALECDTEFVVSSGAVITVAPTNDSSTGDTANLQCAIDAAIAANRYTTILLTSGTFHTAQLVANGFVGSLEGSGIGATVLTNVARPLPVTPVDMYFADPGPQNPWPTLVAFVGGEFRVSDLTVRITGEAPTTGWSIFGIAPPIKALAHVFVVLGTHAEAEFVRLEVEGAPAPGDLAGLNVFNGILFEGFFGTNGLAPNSGRFEVHDCIERRVASPAPIVNVRDTDVAITGNRFEGVIVGAEAGDLENVRYVFAGNHIEAAWAGVQVYDLCQGGSSMCGVSNSSITVAGNAIRSFDGVDVFSTFGPAVSCKVVGNGVEYDAENGGVAVWLGPGTTGCFVSTSGAVLDQGTGNRVVPRP